jgi:hypothetical protein
MMHWIKNIFKPAEKRSSYPKVNLDKAIYYREDNGKWRVKIVSDTWEGDRRTIEMECIEEFHPHMMGSIKPGERLSAAVVKGYESMVGWTLRDENGRDV